METRIGIGVFVRKDINGKDINVGDIVKVTRPEIVIETQYYESFTYPEQSWIGEVRILLTKGVRVKSGLDYIKAPITDKSINKWTWELIEKNMKPKGGFDSGFQLGVICERLKWGENEIAVQVYKINVDRLQVLCENNNYKAIYGKSNEYSIMVKLIKKTQ